MDSKKIKFAKEFCFSSFLDDAGQLIDTGLVDFQIPKDDLFVKTLKNDFVRVSIASEVETVVARLRAAYGRALLRADKIEGDHISFTLMEFSETVLYDQDDPLRIIVDQALAADLRANNIDQEKAVGQIKKQLVVEEAGKHCFAYSMHNESRDLELIGDNYTFTITETPQHYLHITQMRRRINRNRIDFPIVLINGVIEIVNELTDRAILTARADEQYTKMLRSDTEFIRIWNIYNELELESIRQQAKEMGYLKYKGFRYVNGMIIFQLEGDHTRREFCVDGMYYVAIADIDRKDPMEYDLRSATIIGTEIDHDCINTSVFRIKEDMDATRTIPAHGYLLPSISGSTIQKKRREQAQRRILSNKCALPGLKNIIQYGAQVGAPGRKRQPVSSSLEKDVFGDREHHFTERQKLALDAAINTPDIAIIQGPPGTGKTTVIKAIVKRIDELWDSKAKILITSTQHDAVDNAIEEINYGGVPVNRVSVRRGKENEDLLIYDWIDRMITSCEDWLEAEDGNTRGKVREIFEKLLSVERSADLAKQYLYLKECNRLIRELDLSPEVNSKYVMVLAELGANVKMAPTSESYPLVALISGQRLVKEAYLDDGAIQLKKLERYLKFEGEIEFDIPAYWKKLKRITEDCPELDTYLKDLKKDCEKLEQLCAGMGSADDTLLQRDIADLIKAVRSEIISLGNDRKSIVADFIWEFKQELTNSSNVDKLIKAYSKINAATCQQSANPYLSASMNGFDEVYDFVIVDEAARSNPLDLLIPMSMGKKIILVGDHKQLPHMVERDVVQAVAKKSEIKNVASVLEESLFMRLNAAISKEDKTLGISRTAMLNEQYRMHPDICGLVNVFYDGKLETLCKKEDKEHGLDMYDGRAVVWIDLPLSEEYPAEIKRQSVSRQCEVDRIQKELSLILSKNADHSIGIITFYSAQAKLLNDMVHDHFPGDVHRIRVGTVDAFQGKEFDIVLLSVVRANREEKMSRRVGFLDNDNRLCVAFSRAKRLLIAVGDPNTVAYDGERVYVRALYEMYKKCRM